ncbi:hypothetical protein ACFLZ4_01810 [Patescibacteria group bacterium]
MNEQEYYEQLSWKEGLRKTILRDALDQMPFSDWKIARFISKSHGRSKSKKLPIKKYKKKRPNEVLLIGVPDGKGGFGKHFDISEDSRRRDRLRGLLDKYIKEELDIKNIDLQTLGRNEIDYFLDCIKRIERIREELST